MPRIEQIVKRNGKYSVPNEQEHLRFRQYQSVDVHLPEIPNTSRSHKPEGRTHRRHGSSIQAVNDVQRQNERLLRKLFQIGQRKPKIALKSNPEQQLLTLKLKSKEIQRRLRARAIVQENKNLVQRFMNAKVTRNLREATVESSNLSARQYKRINARPDSLVVVTDNI